MKKRQSDTRFIKRHGYKTSEVSDFIDNRGNSYEQKWIAMVASFVNFISAGLKNGFPILVKRLKYPAWAFYPFFFIRRNLLVENPIHVLNHERIHVRQQREILLVGVLPIIFLAIISSWAWILILPFLHTIAYWINVSYIALTNKCSLSYSEVRKRTCFEIEAERFSSDEDYLLHRKPFHNLRFINYKKYLRIL